MIFLERSPFAIAVETSLDIAHLGGQVRRHRVDAFGEVLPGAGPAHDIGLPAKPPFGADLARDPSHFAGEPVELVDHRVDGLLELQNLAADVHGDLLREISARDRRRHLRDVADLAGQVAGHRVHAIGQILPCAGDAQHLRLAAEPAFGSHLTGDARHFGGESIELIHHGVDGVLQLEDLAAHVHGDLARKVAARDRCRHLRNVADLIGQIAAHGVDAVGEIFPRSGHPRHMRLTPELAIRSHFPSDASDFGGEGSKLVDHGIDGLLQLKDFAANVDGDLLGKVAVRNRDRHLGDVAHLAGQVARHRVDALGQIPPNAGHFANLRLAAELSVGADLTSDARHFRGEYAELLDHRIDDLCGTEELALQGVRPRRAERFAADRPAPRR